MENTYFNLFKPGLFIPGESRSVLEPPKELTSGTTQIKAWLRGRDDARIGIRPFQGSRSKGKCYRLWYRKGYCDQLRGYHL